ncbi:MAG: hypothetical protein ACM3PD_04930 [Chloroflexota bacterium]
MTYSNDSGASAWPAEIEIEYAAMNATPSASKGTDMLRSYGLAGLTTLVLFTAPAYAFDVVSPDFGGRVEPYAARIAQAQARGEQVRIGPVECDSSCTLYLAARNSCVHPGAVFGFHAPWVGGPTSGVVDRRMTAVFASAYKPSLRRIFLSHVRNSHGQVPGPLLRLSGMQLASLGYRLCGY